MEPSSAFTIINEEDFEASELIELYKELIRIIEKDIDTYRTGQFGSSPWAIATSIGALSLVFFGITKELSTLNYDAIIQMFLSSLFFIELIALLFKFFFSDNNPVKEKRLYSFKDKFSSTLPFWILRIIYLTGLGWLIYHFWTPMITKVIGLIGVSYGIFWLIVLIVFYFRDQYAGNNPEHKKASFITNLTFLITFGILFLISLFQIGIPTGYDLTVAYILGILLAVFVSLVELLLASAHTPRYISELAVLREEIIFRRIDINEGLLQYRRIKEGKLFFEVIDKDFTELFSKMNSRETIVENQKSIHRQIFELFPLDTAIKEELIVARQKILELISVSNILVVQHDKLSEELAADIKPFVDKSHNLASQSGDMESKNAIDSLITNKENNYLQSQQLLSQNVVTINNQLSILNNKIDSP